MRINLLLAALLFSVPAGAVETEWTNGRIIGDSTGVQAEAVRKIHVTNDRAWRELWAEHVRGVQDAPEAPKVDFTKEMVVGVFLPAGSREAAVKLHATGALPQALEVVFGQKKDGEALSASRPFELRKVASRFSGVRFIPQETVETHAAAGEEKPVSPAMKAVSQDVSRWTASLKAIPARLPAAVFDGNKIAQKGMFIPPVKAEDSSWGSEGYRLQKVGLPPPPGQKKPNGKRLPPPPRKEQGKNLPPPPGRRLPPPPRGGNHPLPPPPGATLPRPIYPGGPLPEDHPRLRGAERTYSTYGMRYVGYWFNGQYWKPAKGVVETSPKDGNVSYILNLESGKYQGYIDFYTADGRVYYAKSEKRIDGRSRRVVVSFPNRTQNPLLPWESESFTFELNGSQISLDSANGAYSYDVSYTFPSNQRGTANIAMTAKDKLLTSPDRNGVSAGLRAESGSLALVITDKWAKYYVGERLDVAFVIRWDDGSFWRRDPVVRSATQRSPEKREVKDIIEINIPTTKGRGKYYLESWSFRRGASLISSGGWINKGQGNSARVQ